MRTISNLQTGILVGVCAAVFSINPCRAQTSFSVVTAHGQTDSQIEQALAQRGSVDFSEVPLRQVVAELSRKFEVQVVLSLKKLEEASVSPETPVTRKATDLSFESILRLILSDLELTYLVRHECLMITTPEDAESQLETRVYPVLDLVTTGAAGLRPSEDDQKRDYDALINVILSTIQPDSWDDVGGPGAVDALDNAGALVISQTRDVHLQIEGLFAALRQAKQFQGLAPPAREPMGHRPAHWPNR